ncbi:hypothetical protein [Enterobacter asburiae]
MTISLNENLKTRRKQLAILAAVIIGGATAAGGVMWYGQPVLEAQLAKSIAGIM